VVTTGSKVDRIAAVDGPVRRRPAKNASIASTVETIAMHPTQTHPAAANPRSTPPDTPARTASVPAAPVMTSAASVTGGTRWTTPPAPSSTSSVPPEATTSAAPRAGVSRSRPSTAAPTVTSAG
jgi:hypothetical protein